MVIPILDNEKMNANKSNSDSGNNSNTNLEKKELIGNRKEFRLDTNRKRLRIIGNGNKIIIYTNEGVLDVIGNMVKVKIIYNCGRINIIGNNSKVYVGKESPVTTIQCTGNDIKFKLLSKEHILTPSHRYSDRKKSVSAPPSPTCKKSFDTIYINNNTVYCSKSSGCSASDICENITNLDKIFKNNISLPNLDMLSKFDLGSSIKIANSTGNIIINNSCNI